MYKSNEKVWNCAGDGGNKEQIYEASGPGMNRDDAKNIGRNYMSWVPIKNNAIEGFADKDGTVSKVVIVINTEYNVQRK